MRRLVLSVAIGTLLGIVAGFVVGWGIAPVRYVDSPLGLLAQPYKEEYTVMVASAYRLDGDLDLAIKRLAPLGLPITTDWVQQVTERYISRGKSVASITDLVALSEAMGRLTPAMEIYRIPPTPAASAPGEG
ncbi:MAG: hypothetical protein JXB47_14985 [Anaerolineae bacterium]|nr:hypothetical protein [Anaerolineae bacterium]